MTAAGFPPVEIPVALAFCAGLWAFRRTSSIAAAFLVSIYVLATVLLGPAGPSLTRFLVVLPVILVFSAMGLASLLEGRRTATRFAAAALLAGALWRGREYGIAFSRGGPGSEYLPESAAAIGERAVSLSESGERVLCVVGTNANTIRFLTAAKPEAVAVSEFYRRPLSPRELPLSTFRPSVVLVENRARFLPWAMTLSPPASFAQGLPFLKVRPPAVGD